MCVYPLASAWKFESSSPTRVGTISLERWCYILRLGCICRFPLIRNTSIAGFDPSLFRVVYSLFFVPLSPLFAFLSSGTHILHTFWDRSVFPGLSVARPSQTGNVVSVWDSGRLKYCVPEDRTNFHKFFRYLCFEVGIEKQSRYFSSCISTNKMLRFSSRWAAGLERKSAGVFIFHLSLFETHYFLFVCLLTFSFHYFMNLFFAFFFRWTEETCIR